MNKTSHFKIYGILAALLLAAGGVVWFSHGRNTSSTSHVARKPVVPKQVSHPPQHTVQTSAETKLTSNANEDKKEVNSIPSGIRSASHLFLYQADDIYDINAKLELNLTPEQLESFREKYLEIVAKRLEIEAEKAQITKIGENSYVVEVPAYKDGIALRDAVATAARQLLASIDKSQLVESVESNLDITNSNWGVFAQKMTIKYDPMNDIYDIQHMSGDYHLSNNVLLMGDVTRRSTVRGTNLRSFTYIINKIQNHDN